MWVASLAQGSVQVVRIGVKGGELYAEVDGRCAGRWGIVMERKLCVEGDCAVEGFYDRGFDVAGVAGGKDTLWQVGVN